jgi:hypothetical protein
MQIHCARLSVALLLILGLVGCATLPEHLPRGPEGHAIPPQPGGALADLENTPRPKLGPDASAWHVTLNEQAKLQWQADGEPLKRQPARSLWQRTKDAFFMMFPRDLY